MDTYLREGLRLELSKVLADYDGVSVMVTHGQRRGLPALQKYYAVRQGTCADRWKFQKVFQDPVTCKAARLTGCKKYFKN